MTGLRTLLEGPNGSLTVAGVLVVLGAVWVAYVHWHRGAPVETAAATTPAGADAVEAPTQERPVGTTDQPSPDAIEQQAGGTTEQPVSSATEQQSGVTSAADQRPLATTDLMTRPEPTPTNQTHATIVEYLSDRSFWPGRRPPRRADLDESSQVFWFFVAPLVAATATVALFPLYSEAIVNTLRGVAIAAAVLGAAALASVRRQRAVPVIWWAVVTVVATVAIFWTCSQLTHGRYGHDVLALRRRADGRSLADGFRILLHRFGFEGSLGLTSLVLGAAVVAAVGCYTTFRLFGVLAAVESVSRPDPGSWHRDLVERVYPRGGPRNATMLVVVLSVLAVVLSGGHPAHWVYGQLHDAGKSKASSDGGSPQPALHNVMGTARSDVLAGTKRPDRIYASGGNDHIVIPADGQKDIVNCGDGRDSVTVLGRREAVDRFLSCELVTRR